MTKLDVARTDFEALPARSAFAERYRKGKPQVVWTRLVADLETPVSAALKLSDGQPMSCLLESVEGGAVRGRYSIIGIAPDIVWRAFGDTAEVNRQPLTDPAAFEVEKLPTLQSLRALLAQSRIDLPPDLPPIAAGVIGYMGYDTVRLVEHLPNQRPDALAVPGQHLRAPDCHGGVRRGQGRDDRGDARLSAAHGRCAVPPTLPRWSACAASLPRSTSRCRTPPPCPASRWRCRHPSPTPRPKSS